MENIQASTGLNLRLQVTSYCYEAIRQEREIPFKF